MKLLFDLPRWCGYLFLAAAGFALFTPPLALRALEHLARWLGPDALTVVAFGCMALALAASLVVASMGGIPR